MKSFFFLIIFLAGTLLISKNIFSSNYSTADTINFSLSQVDGKKYYHGVGDCKADAKVVIDSSNIFINISVKDDNLIFNNDPINSDHVEIWIAVPEAADQNNSYISGSDSSLWLVNSTAELNDFNKEINDPQVTCFNNNYTYHELDSITKDEFDEKLKNVRKGNNKISYVLLGQTHLGVLPGKSQIYVYDKEFLIPLKKGMNCSEANIASYCNCKSFISSKGYTVSVKIPAKALLFLSEKSLRNLRILIDVIDKDKNDSGVSVLSISKKRKWGQPNTYMPINLDTQFGEQILTRQFPPDLIEGIVRPIYFNTTKGWIPVKRVSELVDAGGYTYYYLSMVEQIKFIREKCAYRIDSLNDKLIKIYTTPDDESAIGQSDFVLFSSGRLVCVNQYISSFIMSNGELGVLSSVYEFATGSCRPYGLCGCNIEASLILMINPKTKFGDFYEPKTEVKEEYFITQWSGCGYNVFFNDSLKFNDSEIGVQFDKFIQGDGIIDYGNSFDWSSIISLSPDKKSLAIDLGKGIKIKADWGDSRKEVIYKRLP